MNLKQQLTGWLATVSLAVMMLVFTGCGGSSTTPTVPPATPTNVAVTAGDAQATVSWSAATGATSYNLYYGTAAGVTIANGTKVANATSPQLVGSLAGNTPYYFVVTAVNAGGESGVSSEMPALTIPTKPAGIQLTPGDSQVAVNWTVVAGLTYNIYYSTTAGVTIASGTKVANATNGQVISNLNNGTTYNFVVTAVNITGESGVSSEKSVAPAATLQVPASPTGRTVTSPAPGQITVTWNAVTGATSYKVYYLQASSVPTKAAVLATTPATSTTASLNLTSLTSGTYYVLVTAVNAAGESGTQTNAQAVTVL